MSTEINKNLEILNLNNICSAEIYLGKGENSKDIVLNNFEVISQNKDLLLKCSIKGISCDFIYKEDKLISLKSKKKKITIDIKKYKKEKELLKIRSSILGEISKLKNFYEESGDTIYAIVDKDNSATIIPKSHRENGLYSRKFMDAFIYYTNLRLKEEDLFIKDISEICKLFSSHKGALLIKDMSKEIFRAKGKDEVTAYQLESFDIFIQSLSFMIKDNPVNNRLA